MRVNVYVSTVVLIVLLIRARLSAASLSLLLFIYFARIVSFHSAVGKPIICYYFQIIWYLIWMRVLIQRVLMLMLQLRSCQYQSVIEKRQQQHLVRKNMLHTHMCYCYRQWCIRNTEIENSIYKKFWERDGKQKPQPRWKWNGRNGTGKSGTRRKFNQIKFGSWPIKTIKTLKLGENNDDFCVDDAVGFVAAAAFFPLREEANKWRMEWVREKCGGWGQGFHYIIMRVLARWLAGCVCDSVFSFYFYTSFSIAFRSHHQAAPFKCVEPIRN